MRQVGSAFVFTLVVAVTFKAFFVFAMTPDDWPPVSKPEQCECLVHGWTSGSPATYDGAAQMRVVREPQNTWSNLAYFFLAALIFQRSREALTRGMAHAVILVGIGSLLYHASGSRTLRHIDIAGMYWVYGMVLLLAAREYSSRVRRLFAGVPAPVWPSGALLAAILMTAFRNVRVFGFKPLHISIGTGATAALAAGLLLGICLQRKQRRSWWLFMLVLIFLAIGLVLQIGDRPGGWLCRPGALLQGHALWHLASAACLGVTMLLLNLPTRLADFRTRA